MDKILCVKLGISTKFYLWDIILSYTFNYIHVLNVPVLLSIGVCICKLSFILLHCADRFISRVGTEVTVSVLFHNIIKSANYSITLYIKTVLILSTQEFSTNVNNSVVQCMESKRL